MASVRMTKTDKKDFCNALANKLYEKRIKALRSDIVAQGKGVTTMIASPEQIAAAAQLPDTMVTRKKVFEIGVAIKASENKSRWESIDVELPELTPIPLQNYAYPARLEVLSEKDVSGEKWPTWLRPDSKPFCLNKLFPMIRAYIYECQEHLQFQSSLETKMAPVNTLKQLKDAAPELHDEWVTYFGESVNKPLALRFDDVLETLRKHKEAV